MPLNQFERDQILRTGLLQLRDERDAQERALFNRDWVMADIVRRPALEDAQKAA